MTKVTAEPSDQPDAQRGDLAQPAHEVRHRPGHDARRSPQRPRSLVRVLHHRPEHQGYEAVVGEVALRDDKHKYLEVLVTFEAIVLSQGSYANRNIETSSGIAWTLLRISTQDLLKEIFGAPSRQLASYCQEAQSSWIVTLSRSRGSR